MRILAIDPGTEQSGYVVLDGDGNLMRRGIEYNGSLRAIIHEEAARPDTHLAVEMIASYGMPVGREVFETCVWIGQFVEVYLYTARLPALFTGTLITRREVKQHLCGSAKAKDASIRQALLDRYGPGKEKAIGRKLAQGPLYGVSSHMWSALAVGVTYLDRLKEQGA